MFSLSAPPWRPSPAVRRCEDASATIAITSAHLPLAWHLLVPLSLHNAYRSPACCLTLFRALSDCCLLVGFVPLLFLLWLNLQHMSGYPPPSPHTHTHTRLHQVLGPSFRTKLPEALYCLLRHANSANVVVHEAAVAAMDVVAAVCGCRSL